VKIARRIEPTAAFGAKADIEDGGWDRLVITGARSGYRRGGFAAQLAVDKHNSDRHSSSFFRSILLIWLLP